MKKTWSLIRQEPSIFFEGPIVMGILNATPDSFYNQGRESNTDELLRTAEKMIQDGATILDIGGMSTRPGAEEISPELECARIMPVITLLKQSFPKILLSVDTFRASVAEQAIQAGVDIINDISGGTFDAPIMQVAAKNRTPFICMHTLGKPQVMQQQPQYNDVVTDIANYFTHRIDILNQAGVQNIILDPGFGFGKTIEHNYQLLNNLPVFSAMNYPILVGISRKSMIYKPLNTSPQEALNGTTALHMHALLQGANILRVHDVKEAMECIQLHWLLQANKH